LTPFLAFVSYPDKSFKSIFISLFTKKIVGEITYPWTGADGRDTRCEDFVGNNKLTKVKQLYQLSDDYHEKGLVLNDGCRLLKKSKTPGGHCSQPITNWLIRYDAKGNEEFQKIIVRVTKKPRRFVTSSECSFMDGEEEVMVHSTSILPVVWRLADGTYLIKEFGGATVIRLKDDFISPYVEESDELLDVDARRVFRKYDEVSNDIWKKGICDESRPYWCRGRITGCDTPVECIDIEMTKYFTKLIDQKRKTQ